MALLLVKPDGASVSLVPNRFAYWKYKRDAFAILEFSPQNHQTTNFFALLCFSGLIVL